MYPDFYDPKGNSLILLHSEKGKELFDMIKKDLNYIESSIKECMQPRLQIPMMEPTNRTRFWNDVHRMCPSLVLKKYTSNSWIKQLKKVIRKTI